MNDGRTNRAGTSGRQGTAAKVRDITLVAVTVTLLLVTTIAAGPASQSSRRFAQLIDLVVAAPGPSPAWHGDRP